MSPSLADRSPEPPAAAPVEEGGAVTGAVAVLLRLEGAAAFALSLAAYGAIGGGWATFALLFLVPDVAMLGYLRGPRLGAALYDAAHTYLGPAGLALFAWTQGMPDLYGPALVWAAHIGFDRMLGYGLKYGRSFGATHLGRIGRPGSGRGEPEQHRLALAALEQRPGSGAEHEPRARTAAEGDGGDAGRHVALDDRPQRAVRAP